VCVCVCVCVCVTCSVVCVELSLMDTLQYDATNALKYFLIDRFVKFLLLIGQSKAFLMRL